MNELMMVEQIKYLQAKLGIAFRSRLTAYVHDLYLDNMTFYKVVNLDSRIEGPDQLVTADVAKFCDAVSALYSNLAKPMLDCLIFNYQLTKSVGTGGMIGIFMSYLATAKILRILTPAFGKLAVKEAKLEGDFRNAHARLITNAEEIAFYNGGERELGILNKIYKHLVRHINSIYKIRIFYNMMEDFVIKYSWSAVGLLLTAVPVFYPEWSGRATRKAARLSGGNDAGVRTKDFITNKRLLINLADAGGRVMYSYKELAELAGYTKRVHDMIRVFKDLQANRYTKTLVASAKPDGKPHLSLENIKGEVVVLPSSEDKHGHVQLLDVPVATPSGDVLVNKLSFDIKPGMHCLITGPNGCGKSTVVRIISGLWPVYYGTVFRPAAGDILYIPQRPYLSIGTLRDQIIYPHTYDQMRKVGRTDAELMEILKIVHLAYIPDREGGWETMKEWKDVFSGGEKQRINMARLFYHKPKFAILDECTSAVSSDAEGTMYNEAKDLGITLITVSHRPALLKYHQYLLHLSGNPEQWEFSDIGSQKAVQSLKEEMRDLAIKVREESSLRKRLAEINAALGVNVNATKK